MSAKLPLAIALAVLLFSGSPGASPVAAEAAPTTVPVTTVPATTAPTTTVTPATTAPTTVPPTTVPTGPEPRGEVPSGAPDLSIQRGTGSRRGVGTQNEDGWDQTIVAPAVRGAAVTFTVTIENTGDAAARFRLRGTRARPGFTVTYRSRGADVSGPAVQGALWTPSVAPGASELLRVVVRVLPGAGDGARLPVRVTARTGQADPLVDVVRAVVRLPGIRVRDVGAALGLRRDTTSWDIDVAPRVPGRRRDLVISHHSLVVAYSWHHFRLRPVFSLDRLDTHGCAVADVDLDERFDVYCTVGAGHGTIRKRNRLFLQHTPGVFTESADLYGVSDPLGRGRHPVFFDLNGDPYPDLFVGNEYRREDGQASPNRTYVNVDGERFREVRRGLTSERGALCAQAADFDLDGREDLLLCGGLGRATVGGHDVANQRLFLFRRGPAGRFEEVGRRLGIAYADVRHARLARVNGDRWPDLVVVQATKFMVRLGSGNGFGPPVLYGPLTAGNWSAVGDLDGRSGSDLLIVQGCGGGRNVPDVLLVAQGHLRFATRPMPQARSGCGDTAEAADLDRDGRDEFVIGNGRWDVHGPMQVLTTGMDTIG